ncbi:MAG: pbpE 2 [Phycisphaerales bacterium]|nr:pbpE 2 [Phycisphaerales bacterium]
MITIYSSPIRAARVCWIAVACWALGLGSSVRSAAAAAPPPFDAGRMAATDKAVTDTVARGDIPGAVLLVGRGDRTGGQVLYRKAYGNRAVQPAAEPMMADTLFDLASLSKPVGCATSVMKLIEQGKIKPDEKVATYFPEFGTNGKENVTVAHLLLHQGGLIPDNSIKDYDNGPAEAWKKICALKAQSAPGTKFAYSDVGFIVLGKLVEKVSGKPLNAFAAEEVFGPAGMATAGYLPPADRAANAAPTEKRDGHWMRGEVHDPRAFALGGFAGHAGLFATADDLSRFCRMILDGGTIDGKQVLKAATVAMMTQPRGLLGNCTIDSVPADVAPAGGSARGSRNLRTFGFDCDSGYSAPRGERFERGTTFGHTGFTGTSLWLDPVNDCYVILLTNAVHPDGKGKATPLRRLVGTIAADALLGPKATSQPATSPATGPTTTTTAASATSAVTPVLTGLDVLAADGFKPLLGKRVALVTNQSGLTSDGKRILDLLAANKDVKLVKIFSPEHGLYGVLDEKVSDTTDPTTGLKVFSLYGAVRKPTPEMMAGVDVLVFDMQDVGARYYTYTATMGGCMESCAAAKVKMVVLDRPNPVTGTIVDGPIADEKSLNFTAYGRTPISHGMTIGELARYYNAERKIGCDLDVVAMKGWRRDMWFDETNLTWVNPSPNLRNPTATLLYLGVGQIEFSNVSVGRGTDQPFELLGAPWIDGRRLAAALNAERLPGLRFTPTKFTPASSKFEKKECNGVYIAVTDRQAVEPVKLGVALAWHLKNLFGDQYEIAKVNTLVKNEQTMAAIKTAKEPAEVSATWDAGLKAFRAAREQYLMYK